MAVVPTAGKILVVDDNAENRALFQATLEDEGHTVLLAEGGKDALAAFQATAPDCVLLDVRMPEMNGFEVCTRLRALPGGQETPIIFLTALRDLETFDQALRAGADDFLTKPVRPTELAVHVQAALKLRRVSAELREQYDLVRRQRDDLMRLQLQKERLTSFVVHDLKNPVNTMDLHAQVLLRDPELSPRARTSAEHIREEARTLLRLLLNLLDISKGEEGTLTVHPTETDLRLLIEQAFSAHEVVARAAGVALDRDVTVDTVKVDSDILRRVIDNLLDNAIRHAPTGTAVRVSATRKAGAIEIRVQDEGPGVPLEMRQRIFERFVQVEPDGKPLTRTGRGLGLAFCRLAAEAHGGTISMGEGTKGAAFIVRLPEHG